MSVVNFLKTSGVLAVAGMVLGGGVAAFAGGPAASGPVWDKAKAAKYLDEREVWWQQWPHAAKDHGTICVSCHTQAPYALVRGSLSRELGESSLSGPEQVMLASVLKRVELGDETLPFYNDKDNGPGKTLEGRNAEAVLNAVILVSYDARNGHLTAPARKALARMWASQVQTGDRAGAWVWQNFHYAPWEGDESEYYGAVMAAVAAGTAPDNYASDPDAVAHLVLLREYLKRKAAAQPVVNRVLLLWASAKLPGLLAKKEQAAIGQEILDAQQFDGGWSLETMGTWKRADGSKAVVRSDGYATGLSVLALEETGAEKGTSGLRRGLVWLKGNQDAATGAWPGWSVNKDRKPESDAGKFMSDAGTAFAVMALERGQ